MSAEPETYGSTGLPVIPHDDHGLADRSDELEELSEKDIRIRFYQAMASIDEDRPDLVRRLCKAIASVMYDFCAIHLRTKSGSVGLVAAYDTNLSLRGEIGELIKAGSVIPKTALDRAADGASTTFSPADGAVAAFRHPEDEELELRVHSMIVCPLRTTRGELFGALTIGRHATSRPYDTVDRALLEWIASHVSMKLETARLHRVLKRTNRELAEKAEQLSDAVRVRDLFLATASHELKTPLSTLALQVELMRRALDAEPNLSHRISNNVEALERQVDRLGALVKQLLDVSRLRERRLELQPEDVNLHALVLEVAARFQPEARRRGLQLDVEGESVAGYWDPSRLDQVISNLISNAIKYSESGSIRVTIRDEGETGLIRVEDEGIGMEPETIRRIFRRFERGRVRSVDGIGLGLWIVRRITERMGGRIAVRSEIDVGTAFEVRLPYEMHDDHPSR